MDKQLEGLFNKTIDRNNSIIVNGGLNFKNLYHLNKKKKKKWIIILIHVIKED